MIRPLFALLLLILAVQNFALGITGLLPAAALLLMAYETVRK